jgi:NitT/TauT family transport system permease protein
LYRRETVEEKPLSWAAAILAPVVMFFILFGGWELAVRLMEVPVVIVPGPIAIFRCIYTNFGELAPHFWLSLTTILCGYFLSIPCGLLFAAIITNFKLINDALSPFVILLVTTPLIVLMPILCINLGFGMNVRIIGTLIQCFPIINMNACTGYNNVPKIRLELMQSLRANRIQRFFHVIFPTALPDVFSGLRLAAIFATTACIGVEFVASSAGLGNRISFYTAYYKMDYAFACIFLVGVVGLVLYGAASFLEKKVLCWNI